MQKQPGRLQKQQRQQPSQIWAEAHRAEVAEIRTRLDAKTDELMQARQQAADAKIELQQEKGKGRRTGTAAEAAGGYSGKIETVKTNTQYEPYGGEKSPLFYARVTYTGFFYFLL